MLNLLYIGVKGRQGCKIHRLEKIGASEDLSQLKQLLAFFNEKATRALMAEKEYSLKNFEPLTLAIKNCFNQGETAIFVASKH